MKAMYLGNSQGHMHIVLTHWPDVHTQSVHQFKGGEWYYAKDMCPTGAGIKIDKPKAFNGSTKDLSVLDSFIYAFELYFKLTNLYYPSQKALMALLWLEEEASIWWKLVKAGYPLDWLAWSDLKALLQH